MLVHPCGKERVANPTILKRNDATIVAEQPVFCILAATPPKHNEGNRLALLRVHPEEMPVKLTVDNSSSGRHKLSNFSGFSDNREHHIIHVLRTAERNTETREPLLKPRREDRTCFLRKWNRLDQTLIVKR